MDELTDKINNFYTKGVPTLKKFLSGLPLDTLKNLRKYYDDLYYNDPKGSPIPDSAYDVLFNLIITKEPVQKEAIGAKLREGDNRVELPYWLGSMDKYKPTDGDKLNRWIKKFKSKDGYTISEKLDGVSCLLVVENEKINLYTRGDGKIGADISYLQTYIKGIPTNLSRNDISIRGELIINKKAWGKYSNRFSNARQLVSGLVNSKTAREGLNDIEFIPYEIVDSEEKLPPIYNQFEKLEKMGFKTALYTVVDSLDIEKLMEILTTFKSESEYEIDGIIIQTNNPYTRNVSGNPDYAFAFKMMTEENILPTKVLNVEWNLSKRGLLKPRIEVEPINLSGVVIKFATGFNAKFIKDNGIGPGAVVNITRSGDVIPYIVSVSKNVEPSFPDEEWTWKTDSEVDIVPVEINQEELCLKIFKDFFVTFGIQFVSDATIKKIQEAGFDTILKILEAKKTDFQKITGDKSGEKIYNNIHNGLKNITLAQLMTASSLFEGVALKKFESLLEEIPDLLALDEDVLYKKILSVKGFSEISAKKIVKSLPSFILFMNEIASFLTFKKDTPKKKEGELAIKVVFSGFRDKDLEERIVSMGGEVTSAVSKKTTHLVVKDKDESSSKIEKARELGIPVMERDEFEKLLG
jgi:NAD-dependent DNA ligase